MPTPGGQHPTAADSPLFAPNKRPRPPAPPPTPAGPSQQPTPAALTQATSASIPGPSSLVVSSGPQDAALTVANRPRASANPSLFNSTTLRAPPSRRADSLRANIRPKIDFAVKQFFGVTDDLRSEAEDLHAFRFDLDPDVAEPLIAKFAQVRGREAAERRRVIDAAYDRISTTLCDVLETMAQGVAEERTTQLWSAVETLQVTVKQLSQESSAKAPASPAPATVAPPVATTPVGPDLTSVVARIEGMERLYKATSMSIHGVAPRLEALSLRLQALEEAARKSSDPRVRPGSQPAQPATPPVANGSAGQTLATKAELAALQKDLDSLTQRLEANAAAAGTSQPGKRARTDGPATDEGPTTKIPRTAASAADVNGHVARSETAPGGAQQSAATTELGARSEDKIRALGGKIRALGARVTSLEGGGDKRVEAMEEMIHKRLDAMKKEMASVNTMVDVKFNERGEVVALDESVDMDLESNGPDGLEVLEQRLVELQGELGAELTPLKTALKSLETGATRLSSANDALSAKVTALDVSVSGVEQEVAMLKTRRELPPPSDPNHPEQLLHALQELRGRIPPALPEQHRRILDVLHAFLLSGPAPPMSPSEVAAQLRAKLSHWDAASETQDLVHQLVRQLADNIAFNDTKFSALSDFVAFAQNAFPELKRLSDLIEAWRKRRVLPDAAWQVHEEARPDDRDGITGKQGETLPSDQASDNKGEEQGHGQGQAIGTAPSEGKGTGGA